MWLPTLTALAVLLLATMVQSAKVLIYSATAGFRHDSIPTAIEALKSRGHTINVDFDDTEDRTRFTDTVLDQYDAIVFLSTTGEGEFPYDARPCYNVNSYSHLVLDDAGKQALQRYLDAGGNFAGIHSASDSLVNTTFYGQELGAYFDYHADLQNATVNVIGPAHPATSGLPRRWQLHDEWYNLKADPRDLGATVILSVDESTYTDTGTRRFNQGSPHPTAWFQERGAGVSPGGLAGRSFYTSLGHTIETWQDDVFLGHVLGGISWVIQSGTTRASNGSAVIGNAISTSTTGSSPTLANPTQNTQATQSSQSQNTAPSNKLVSGGLAALMFISIFVSLIV